MPYKTTWKFSRSQSSVLEGIRDAITSTKWWNLIDISHVSIYVTFHNILQSDDVISVTATRSNKRGWIYDVELRIHKEIRTDDVVEVQVDFSSKSRESLYDLSIGQVVLFGLLEVLNVGRTAEMLKNFTRLSLGPQKCSGNIGK